ncbi:MAG: tail fiber domain-containing protein [Armatimonadetes bacterium]|nr:tail fiber domain-containing protein [Armatimonadota bacterium]
MYLRAVVVFLIISIWAVAPVSAINTAFNYQGKLTDSGGAPLSGAYDLTFKLFDAETVGNQVGSDVVLNGVNVSGGLFTVELDFGTSAFDGSDRWLEITVGAETLSPRTKINSTPYAAHAGNVPWSGVTGSPTALPPSGPAGGDLTGNYPNPTIGDNKVTAAKIANGAVTGSKLATRALESYIGNIQNLPNYNALPTVVGIFASGVNSTPSCVAVSGTYAYIIKEGYRTLQVVDISNPTRPASLGYVYTVEWPRALAVSGRYAYVGTSGVPNLRVVDLSNPSSPTVVGSADTGSAVYAVAVAGRYAYALRRLVNTMAVVDISNPASPVVVGSIATGTTPDGIRVSGRYAYVTCTGSNVLQVIDVSNPAAPSLVGSVATNNSPASLAVCGRYAYVANVSSNTLQIIDLSNPAAPTVAGSVTTANGPRSVAVSGRYAYVAASTSWRLQVIDISDPTNPAVVGWVSTDERPWQVEVSGRYAYVLDSGADRMEIIDVTGLESTAVNAHSLQAGSLQVRGSAVVAEHLTVRGCLNVNGNGNFTGTLSSNGVALTSDAAFKTNVDTLSDSLKKVLSLRGVSFDWKNDKFPERNFPDGPQIGFIAQEVENVLPELVSVNPDGYRGVHYANLVPVLVEAIKEQQKRIDYLQRQLKELRCAAGTPGSR